MKSLKERIKNFIISGFFIGSIFSTLLTLIYIGSVVFGYRPYYELKNVILNSQFENGIPLPVKIHNLIVDSTILLTSIPTSISELTANYPKQYTDTVFSNTDTMAVRIAKSPFADVDTVINKRAFTVGEELEFTGMTIHVKPKNFKERAIFMFPNILGGLLMSFCLWQLATFLQYIRIGSSFDASNHKRLRKIGLALITYNVIMILFDLYFSGFSVRVNIASELGSKPFYLSGTPDLSYGYLYFYAGCIFIILSSAFKKGNQLQEEQDLTF